MTQYVNDPGPSGRVASLSRIIIGYSALCMSRRRSTVTLDGHGPVFMGLYARLLVRYLRLDETHLLTSIEAAGISIARDARPVFLDSIPGPGPP